MLDYTKAAIEKIVNDCKKFAYLCNVIIQAVSLTYLVYALIAGSGNVWVNVALLALTLAYFVFFLIVRSGEASKEKAQTAKTGKRVFGYCKKLVKLFNLTVIIYGVYATAQAPKLLPLVQIAFMLVGWVLGVMFDVLTFIIERYKNLLLEGIKADLEPIVKPARAVGNFFKGLKGQEIEPQKEPTKNRLWLNEKVAAKKEARKNEKLAEKQAKKETARKAKETRKQGAELQALPAPKDDARDEIAVTTEETVPAKKKTLFGRRKK